MTQPTRQFIPKYSQMLIPGSGHDWPDGNGDAALAEPARRGWFIPVREREEGMGRSNCSNMIIGRRNLVQLNVRLTRIRAVPLQNCWRVTFGKLGLRDQVKCWWRWSVEMQNRYAAKSTRDPPVSIVGHVIGYLT